MIKKLTVFFLMLISLSLFAQETEVRKQNLDIAIGIDEIVRLDYKFSQKIY